MLRNAEAFKQWLRMPAAMHLLHRRGPLWLPSIMGERRGKTNRGVGEAALHAQFDLASAQGQYCHAVVPDAFDPRQGDCPPDRSPIVRYAVWRQETAMRACIDPAVTALSRPRWLADFLCIRLVKIKCGDFRR